MTIGAKNFQIIRAIVERVPIDVVDVEWAFPCYRV